MYAPVGGLPKGKPTLSSQKCTDCTSGSSIFNSSHYRIYRAPKEWNLAVEGPNELGGLLKRDVQLVGELLLTHAIHESQADGLGLLTLDAGHVGHHLVEVSIGVFPIGLGHGL